MNSPLSLLRTILRGSAWIAVVALMACSVSVDSEGEIQRAALIDRLPAGATAIAWFDIEALAAAVSQEKWDEYEEMFQDDEDLQDLERFTEATGIDPREDMKQLAVAVMPGAAEDDDPVVLVTVDFDEDKLLALIGDAETITYEGTAMYVAQEVLSNLEEAVGGSEVEAEATDEMVEIEVESEIEGYLAILDSQTLAMGTEEGLKVIIDVAGGRHDALKSDPAMNDLISDVAGQGQIWFVATSETWDDQIDDLAEGGGGMVPIGAIEGIEVMTMSMRVGDGITMRLAGVTSTAEDAGLLADTLNGGAAMGKMMLQQNQPELFDILDRGMSVGHDDRTVYIEASLTDADIEVLQGLAEEQREALEIGIGAQ